MIFPTNPVYRDPPNWNQQADQLGSIINAGGGAGLQLPLGVSVVPQPESGMSGTPATAARPGSMSERARLAKAPRPEPALKCPRCDSTNTKFCYYNNYSLSQPRHFCKTCRRYWTRGGTLRNVPVGGGCRRHRPSKPGGGSSSKSSATASASAGHQKFGGSSTTSSTASMIPLDMLMPHQLPFMTSLQPLGEYYSAPNLGLGFSGTLPVGMQDADMAEYHWQGPQLQHLPFLGSTVPPPPPPLVASLSAPVPTVYSLDIESEAIDGGSLAGQVAAKAAMGCSGLIDNPGSVKMEENPQGGLSLARQYLGIPQNDNIWGTGSVCGGSSGGGWAADLSGFNNPSSAGNLM